MRCGRGQVVNGARGMYEGSDATDARMLFVKRGCVHELGKVYGSYSCIEAHDGGTNLSRRCPSVTPTLCLR